MIEAHPPRASERSVLRRWGRMVSAVVVAWLAVSVIAVSGPAAATLDIVDARDGNAFRSIDPDAFLFAPICNLRLTGEIVDGDAARIEAQIDTFKPVQGEGPRQPWHAVCLASSGGDFAEAHRIGGLLVQWTKVVGDGDTCAGACAVVFFYGEPRETRHAYVPRAAGRYLHYRGRLAIHGPTVGNGVLVTGDSLAILGLLGSRDLVMAFVAHRASEPYVVSDLRTALEWGIEVFGIPSPRRVTREMLATACLNVAVNRLPAFHEGVEPSQILDRSFWWRSSGAEVADLFQRREAEAKLHRPGPRYQTPAREWAGYFIHREETERRVEIFELLLRGSEFCEIRATWRGDQFWGLEIETFNSPRQHDLERRLLMEGSSSLPHGPLFLRAWKMLPGVRRLDELGADAWGDLDVGPDFFDRPTVMLEFPEK